ncbi:hypothetical protein Tco_0588162 [Tanacetum coccineum]
METKDTLSSCSNLEEQQMQQFQDKAKKSCMVSFRQLHSHLKLLSNNDLKGTRTECGFKRAFATLFGQDLETFTSTIIYTQLEIPEFHDTLIQHMESVKKSIDERAQHKQEYESRDTSSRSKNDAHADDADIKPIYDEEPMVEVQLIADHNVFATGQHQL